MYASDIVVVRGTLLERILLVLDMRTLLLSQRVSRKWQTTIKSSDSLQKRLFFRPADASEILTLGIAANIPHAESGFIIPLQFPYISPTALSSSQFSVFNPLFPRTFGLDQPRSKYCVRIGAQIPEMYSTNLHFPKLSKPGSEKRMSVRECAQPNHHWYASWIGMLVTQPPNLSAYPRGYDGRYIGGTVKEIVGMIPTPKVSGKMFILLEGLRMDGNTYWAAVEREREEKRQQILEKEWDEAFPMGAVVETGEEMGWEELFPDPVETVEVVMARMSEEVAGEEEEAMEMAEEEATVVEEMAEEEATVVEETAEEEALTVEEIAEEEAPIAEEMAEVDDRPIWQSECGWVQEMMEMCGPLDIDELLLGRPL